MGRHTAHAQSGRHRLGHLSGRMSRSILRDVRFVRLGRIPLVAVVVATLSASTLAGGSTLLRSRVVDTGPSTLEALTATNPDLSPPPSLVSPRGDSWQDHSAHVARSATRLEYRTETGTVYCDGIVTDPGTNGRVPDAELCDLWQRPYKDRADAAVALFALNDEYAAVFGEPMCLTSAYRTYEEQAALRRKKGGIAAPAGLSNHGWGLAVDFCSQTYTGERGD